VSVSTMFGLGVSVMSAPSDRQRDVRERRFDGSVGLVHGDLRSVDPRIREADAGESVDQRLDQVDGVPLTAFFTLATRLP